jgi:beta-1,4-glucosyltransferase
MKQHFGKPVVPQRLTIAGFPVEDATREQALERLLAEHARGEPVLWSFVNHNCAVTMQERRDELLATRPLLHNDGVAIGLAAKLIHGRGFSANLNGTDLMPWILHQVPAGWRVAFLGARPGRAQAAAERLTAGSGVQVVLVADGYDGMADIPALLDRLRQARPDLVLIGLGDPRQSCWFLEHRHRLPPAVYAGIGALFDFYSGSVPRAPRLMRRLSLEWLYRLVREPGRMWRRYTVDGLRFALLCWRQRRLAG